MMRLSKPALLRSFAYVARRRVVRLLRLRLQVDVREDAGTRVIARAEKIQAHLGVHAVDAAAQPRLKGHITVGLNEKRVEEHLTELPIADPGLAFGPLVKRGDVDEHRRGAFPLKVVRRGVLQTDAFVEAGQHQVELQQRRVSEHLERPFVRVGHERKLFVLEHASPLLI